jgi:predicted acetyltransferase
MPAERFETFRPAQRDEIDEIAAVVTHSFPAPSRGREWWRDYLANGPHAGPGTIWVAEEDGRIVGCCLLLSLTQWIAGAPIPVMGLGVVATLPTHRRRGLAGRMVAAGFRQARERGDLGSVLYPFRIGYYGGLGYGLAGEAHQYIVPAASLPDAPAERRRVRLVRTPEDRAMLRAVYARGIRLQTGQVERDDHAWSYVTDGDDRSTVLYVSDEGEAEGYAIVRYRADLPVAERFLDVEERMWLTLAARDGIYAWLSSMGDQWPHVAYRAHPDERFGERIAEPRLPIGSIAGWNLWFPSATILRGPMFRLLNVPGALTRRNYAGGEDLEVTLEVEDPQVPENSGPWRLRIARGRGAVEQGRVDGGATMSVHVRELSRIFVGAIGVSDAIVEGLARLDRPRIARELDAAFEVPRPWTFERF